MIGWISLGLLAITGFELAEKNLMKGNFKEAIYTYEKLLEEQKDIGEIKAKLAVAHYKDQDQEKAFKIYLEALEETSAKETAFISEEESHYYKKALEIYLEAGKESSQEVAVALRKEFAPIYSMHPEYSTLGYIMAVAYANLGMYEEFFETFYHSYKNFPDHYLAVKTKGVLYIKLMERARLLEEREKYRERVLTYFREAVEKNPEDISLYRMLMVFSDEKNRSEIVKVYLKKIVDANMMVPRTDIQFYVQQAVAIGEYDLAQKFIDKSKEWYSISRMITAAQQHLDQHRKQ